MAQDRDGNAVVSCTMEKAGAYRLHVSLQHQQLRLLGSPLHLHVVPARASAAQSRIIASSADLKLTAGERRTVVVRTADRFGNACLHGGAKVKAVGHEALQCAVHDRDDGAYAVSWHSTTRGRFSLELLVHGEPVTGSPLSLLVEPARLYPANCVPAGETEQLVAGDTNAITVFCADQYGNAVRPSAAQFGVRLHDTEPRELQRTDAEQAADDEQEGGSNGSASATLQAYWVGDGAYEIRYTCVTAGRYWLQARA
eukprot:900431-Prymnesium_polylepis.1